MTPETLGLRFAAAMSVFLLTLELGHGVPSYGSVSTKKPPRNLFDGRKKNGTPIHKVLMTQRGYIQFLRWELPVPEIEEFTFCLWVKSTNLTYAHSIFSYSKNEEDRLARAWISSHGRSVHLEIDNVEIFAHPSYIEEHRWYHVGVSWNNADGRYALWIDGQKKTDGYATKMAGHVIPSKGDIVLGQEYTDFDKGLEEGIEGAVLGFNLILSSAFESSRSFFERNKLDEIGFQGETDLIDYESTLSSPIYGSQSFPRVMAQHPVYARTPMAVLGHSEVSSTSRRSSNPRFIRSQSVLAGESRRKRKSHFSYDWGNKNAAETRFEEKPLGQQLVETSFEHCEWGRGSPHIGGELMLISWTRTPVKVFGGAIIKNAKSDCGNF